MAKLTGLTKNTFGLNSGASTLSQLIPIDKIELKEVFEQLIPINENDLANLTESMKETGFDVLHPVCIWREENILIDGHTRRQAAIKAGLTEIYCYKKSFPDEKSALEYAIQEQLRRRNIDDAGKIILIEKLDQIKRKGRPSANTEKETNEPKGKSSEILAQTLGISASTVERARSVLKNADEETKQAVRSGEITINKAYNTVKEKQKVKNKPLPQEPIVEVDPFDIEETIDEDNIIDNQPSTIYLLKESDFITLQKVKVSKYENDSEKLSVVNEVFENIKILCREKR